MAVNGGAITIFLSLGRSLIRGRKLVKGDKVMFLKNELIFE